MSAAEKSQAVLHPFLVELAPCPADCPGWLTLPVECLFAVGPSWGAPSVQAVFEQSIQTADYLGVALLAGPSSPAAVVVALPSASYVEAAFLA